MLRSRKQVALDIMCEYLVNKDDGDTLNMVRQEAWLTLWTLTGIAYGVSEPQKFRNLPKAVKDQQIKRDYLFRPAQIRPGRQDIPSAVASRGDPEPDTSSSHGTNGSCASRTGCRPRS